MRLDQHLHKKGAERLFAPTILRMADGVPRQHRRSIRLRDYDYAQSGAYFITICAHERACLFGDISNEGEAQLSEFGRIVEEEWLKSAEIRREIELDAHVVMPNHIHAVVLIVGYVGAHGRAPLPQGTHVVRRQPRSLGSLIAGFKSSTTKRINETRRMPGAPVWQLNYYEHIIRNERELLAIRGYIENNPMNWALDRENPVSHSTGK